MIQESEIWEKFKSGHTSSFEWIYDRYSKELFKYGCGFSFDQDLVEDCIQELFTSLWQKRKGLGPTTSIKFYLLGSLRRMLVRKTSQSKKRALNEIEFYDAFQHQSSPESIFILEEEDGICNIC
ncbi:RNA polymerase sigma factor [Pedobacter sp. SL55]|uniref:RNA polymerase sigma factor n=1 Tax=Pedobacter sp. SL55 TaxID=2995161 RepID=UPI0022702D96|nr:sigma factor [Pedobacter sp. SL55]WAC40384.1 hypothetical protein OVA16_17715 [Pedobacter sp. SL55]